MGDDVVGGEGDVAGENGVLVECWGEGEGGGRHVDCSEVGKEVGHCGRDAFFLLAVLFFFFVFSFVVSRLLACCTFVSFLSCSVLAVCSTGKIVFDRLSASCSVSHVKETA